MPKLLQLKFDPNQQYQLDAIQSVVEVFHGLPYRTSEFALGDEAVPNLPPLEMLSEKLLYDNARWVRERNKIPMEGFKLDLDVDQGEMLEGVTFDTWRYPHFTIEMETGTGKTYVYLRTIHELRKQYGFRKFVIVVPSVAIYEGVIKNLEITRTHFNALYGNENVEVISYEGGRLSALRGFAASPFVSILIMTIQSFNSRSNVIYRASEQLQGERLPYQYIQATRPILILDEPQNMESELSQRALRTLQPLCALRYSATHRTTPNLLPSVPIMVRQLAR